MGMVHSQSKFVRQLFMWEQLLDMFQKADRSVEIYDGMLERGVEERGALWGKYHL